MRKLRLNLLFMVLVGCVVNVVHADEAADRWRPAIDKFLADDEAHPTEPGGVVFVGSSSIRFWDLGRSFPSLGAVNRGFGGSQVSDSLAYLDELVLKHKPRLVVLYAGDNDIAAGESVEEVYGDVVQFVDRVHDALPEARIAYLAIKPSRARWKLVDKMRAVNDQVDALAAEREELTYVDVFHATLGANGQPREELFIADGLHLNKDGYDVWSAVLNDTVGGLSPAYDPKVPDIDPLATVEDQEGLPRVLLIGDSISMGYTIPVRKRLAGVANVHRIGENGGPTIKALDRIEAWLGDSEWDVIHFNWGLHDVRRDTGDVQVSIEDYEKNLTTLVERLKQTGATLVWASTTPIPEGASRREPGDEVKYNAVAARVMESAGIATDDLYAFALDRLDRIQRKANVHFTPAGSAALADVVAREIRAVLDDDGRE